MTLVKESLLELKREVIFLLEIYFFTGKKFYRRCYEEKSCNDADCMHVSWGMRD